MEEPTEAEPMAMVITMEEGQSAHPHHFQHHIAIQRHLQRSTDTLMVHGSRFPQKPKLLEAMTISTCHCHTLQDPRPLSRLRPAMFYPEAWLSSILSKTRD